MILRPPRSTRTDTLLPVPTLVRTRVANLGTGRGDGGDRAHAAAGPEEGAEAAEGNALGRPGERAAALREADAELAVRRGRHRPAAARRAAPRQGALRMPRSRRSPP